MNSKSLDEKHIVEVCKRGKPGTCAFLALSSSFECAKGTSIESVIRGRLAEGTMRAKGDNCSGPPTFKIPNS